MKLFSKKRILFHMAAGIFCLSAAGCGRRLVSLQKADTFMGTMVTQTLYAEEGRGEETAREIFSCVDGLEKLLSWRLPESELYQINENAGKEEGASVSEELMEMLLECMEVSEASDGAFDITIGDVVQLWDIDSWARAEDSSAFAVPEETEIQAALQDTGYQQIRLQDGKIILPANFKLDMGAVGKGIALDEVRRLLEAQEEVTGAVISVGGSILTYGSKPDGSLWNVAVVNPSKPSERLGILKLEGQWCVSTSGDYERYVEADGRRYHHILNPDTGRPAESGVRGVTILTKGGLYSDALSTACFVLGAERGMELAEQFQAEALFVLENGELVMSEGMRALFYEQQAIAK